MKRTSCLVATFTTALLGGSISVYADPTWTTPAPLTEVNSSVEEWSPFLSYDGLTLYFARVRSDTSYYGRIYEATRATPSGPFTNVQEVSGPLNSLQGHVVCEWVSPDNLRMYYHSEVGGVFSLNVSTRASVSDPWPTGTPISELNALGSRLQMPRLTPDELTIFFDASDIPGGVGGYDLWMATRPNRSSPFGNVRCLTELNTTALESGGTITPGGLEVIFGSGRNGVAQELYSATRPTSDSPFNAPIHLSAFDVPGAQSAQPSLAADGSALYFMVQMDDDASTQDIWVSYSAAPAPVPIPGAALLGTIGLIFAGWRLRTEIAQTMGIQYF